MIKNQDFFWLKKKWFEFSEEEWESVCDFCGKCCLHKIGFLKVKWTKVACQNLNIKTGKCSCYANRWDSVPECIKLTPQNLKKNLKYLPKTCAYKWLYKKGILPPFHPLVCGRSMKTSGLSVVNRAIAYDKNIDLNSCVVKWDDI